MKYIVSLLLVIICSSEQGWVLSHLLLPGRPRSIFKWSMFVTTCERFGFCSATRSATRGPPHISRTLCARLRSRRALFLSKRTIPTPLALYLSRLSLFACPHLCRLSSRLLLCFVHFNWIHTQPTSRHKQLLEAIAYMHERGIMHRDIKLSNLLFSDDGELKVADLGSIREAGRTQLKLTTAVVTIWWVLASA